MSTQNFNKSSALRKLFASKPIVRIVGAHNALGAKLIEQNGFEGIWASGLEISTSRAVPDANILTMTDSLQASSQINEATSLPVICDCDTGYGNSSNVWHMVKKYEAAGIAGVVIEDKIFPKTNSFIPGRQELADLQEFCGKLEAARSAKVNPDFMVFARVEALIAGWGMEEALKRAQAYVKAGADGIVIHSKAQSPDEIFEFAARYKETIPLVAIPTMYPAVTDKELQKRGFKMVIYANHGLRASIRAMQETLKTIAQEGSTQSVEHKIASMKEVFELQGMPWLQETEKKYSKKNSVKAIIPAAGKHSLQAGFGNLLKDKPLCMIDIGDRSLLDRQCEALFSCGIKDITVVGGPESGQIRSDGIRVIINHEYDHSGSAYSCLCAKEMMDDKCLIAYSDIIYDRGIIERLLQSPHDITIVIDKSYRSLPQRDKKLDLVIAEPSVASTGQRSLESSWFKRVNRIGTSIDKKSANYEFIGIVYLSQKGASTVKKTWDTLSVKSPSPFYESANLKKADLNDLLQYLIDQGQSVHGLEIESGWSEIHSLSDLERIRSHYHRTSSAKIIS